MLVVGGIMFSKLLGVDKSEPQIVTLDKEFSCLGMVVRTDDKKMMSDLPKVYSDLMNYKNSKGISDIKIPWEYISLSTNFDEKQNFDYFTGYVVTKNLDNLELKNFSTPKGTYAIFKIRGKNKMIFGLVMGLTKKFIYTEWLPKTKYEFGGYEFEYNNEEMNKINPYDIDLYVLLKDK